MDLVSILFPEIKPVYFLVHNKIAHDSRITHSLR